MRHLVYKYCNICNQEYDVLFRYTSLVRYICGFPHHLVNSRLCDSVSRTGTENNFDYWCYVWRWNPECQVKLRAFVQASRAVDCLVMWLEQFIRRWNYGFSFVACIGSEVILRYHQLAKLWADYGATIKILAFREHLEMTHSLGFMPSLLLTWSKIFWIKCICRTESQWSESLEVIIYSGYCHHLLNCIKSHLHSLT